MAQINFGLEDLQAFVAVADKANFRAAAAALCISQPALSRRIDKLEGALGARLFERTTRKVSLTNVGRPFLDQARNTLDGLESAVLRLTDTAQQRRGLITVACVPSVAHHWLPDVLRQFANQYPSVRLRVIDENANTVLASVLSGDADFGLNFVGTQEPEIEFEAVAPETYVLVVPRSHRWAQRRSVRWAELAEENMVSVSRQSGNRMLLDNALAHLAKRPVAFYEANHVTGAIGLVEAGLGVAALPSLALAANHPTLKGIALVEPQVQRMLGLIKRKGQPLTPLAASLYATLQKPKPAKRRTVLPRGAKTPP